MFPKYAGKAGIEFLSEFFSLFARFVIYLLGTALLCCGLLFIGGGSLNGNLFFVLLVTVIALAVTARDLIHNHNFSIGKTARYLASCIVLTAVLSIAVSNVYDKSWDGMAYHQITVLKLFNGWNPVYEILPSDPVESKYYSYKIALNSYVNHYPKAHEILSAMVFVVTNRIESGKVINLLLLLASFGSVYTLVRRLGLTGPWGMLLSVAAAFNPITLNQMLSYYIDGALASLMLIFICELISLYLDRDKGRPIWSPSLFLVITILMNLKFTAVVYVVLLCLLFIIFLLIYKEYEPAKRFLANGVSAGVVAVFVIGFNPYIKNTLGFGHPFHPVSGKYKEDIITPYLPAELANSNSAVKFFSSTFSESANFDSRKMERRIKLKLPFTFDMMEIKAFQSEGVRMGGFGVLWSGILLFSFLTIPFTFARLHEKQRYLFAALILALLMTVIINPEAWWARFVPQLWLFPVAVTFAVLLRGNKAMISTARGVVVILILNAILVGAVSVSSTLKNTLAIRKEFRQLQQVEKPLVVYYDIFSPVERRLQENRIPFVTVNKLSDLPCASPETISKFDYCLQ